MKKIDLGQMITILANVGVIAGIVFLGFELQQNNRLMEAEARRARTTSAEESYRLISENGELAAIIQKDANNEPLTNVELQRMLAYWLRSLTGLELAYKELPENERGPWIERYRLNIKTFPSLSDAWQRRSGIFDSEFVQWFEENIVDE